MPGEIFTCVITFGDRENEEIRFAPLTGIGKTTHEWYEYTMQMVGQHAVRERHLTKFIELSFYVLGIKILTEKSPSRKGCICQRLWPNREAYLPLGFPSQAYRVDVMLRIPLPFSIFLTIEMCMI